MYGLSGVKPLVPQEWIDAYKKGTKPQGDVSQEQVDLIDKALFSSLDKLKEDLSSDLFKNFQPYTTSSKMELESIETAFPFILFHDGIHIGTVLALAKLV
jgi:hypothetical protein